MIIEIVDFPINSMVIFHSCHSYVAIYSGFSHKKMVIFHSYVNVYQRVLKQYETTHLFHGSHSDHGGH